MFDQRITPVVSNNKSKVKALNGGAGGGYLRIMEATGSSKQYRETIQSLNVDQR